MEHLLENSWTLYVTKQRTVQGFEKNTKEWEDRLEKICSINSAEFFWSVQSNLKNPSEMKNERGDIYLFKGSILPEWEDSNNVGGGSLTLFFDPNKVDEVWLRIQLAVIGNYLEHCCMICGLELAIRKNRFKIAVWVENGDLNRIRRTAEEVKEIVNSISVEYKKHNSEKTEFVIK